VNGTSRWTFGTLNLAWSCAAYRGEGSRLAAIDFVVFGMDTSWSGARWLSHIDGSFGKAATGVTLTHANQSWPSRGQTYIAVQTHRRGQPLAPGQTSEQELAFKAMLALFNLLPPDLDGPARRQYFRHGMRYVDYRAAKARSWADTTWTIDGMPTSAKFARFAGGWAGFTQAIQEADVEVAIAAYGTRPDEVKLRRLTSGDPYHFDLAAPLTPRVLVDALRSALGDLRDEELPAWPLHADMRRVLNRPPPEPKPDPNAKYRVSVQSSYQSQGWEPWNGPPPEGLAVSDPDVPRMSCCVCDKNTEDDPAEELVYLRIQLVSGTFTYSLGAHLACLPQPIQPRQAPGPGPGREIQDGWVVAPDSHLDGVAFPDSDGGWTAIMTIDDHPLAVLQAYLAQAAAHGIPTQVQCEAHIPRGRLYTLQLLDDSKPISQRVQAIVCRASGGQNTNAPTWLLYLHWGTYYDRKGPTFASLVMQVHPSGSKPRAVPVTHAPQVMPSMINWTRPTIPAIRQQFDGNYTGATLHVAEGSTVVAPIADDSCGSAAIDAVLHAAAPSNAADDYLKQFAASGITPGPTKPLAASATITQGSVAGGTTASLIQLTRGTDHWLIIQLCND